MFHDMPSRHLQAVWLHAKARNAMATRVQGGSKISPQLLPASKGAVDEWAEHSAL